MIYQQKLLFCMYRERERGLEFHRHETSQRCFSHVGKRMILALSRFHSFRRIHCAATLALSLSPCVKSLSLYGPPAPFMFLRSVKSPWPTCSSSRFSVSLIFFFHLFILSLQTACMSTNTRKKCTI